jgi:hypothetical protein
MKWLDSREVTNEILYLWRSDTIRRLGRILDMRTEIELKIVKLRIFFRRYWDGDLAPPCKSYIVAYRKILCYFLKYYNFAHRDLERTS